MTFGGYILQNKLKHHIDSDDEKVIDQNSAIYDVGSIKNFKNSLHMNKNGEIESTYINESRINPYDAYDKAGKIANEFMFSPGMKTQKEYDDIVERIGLVFQPLLTPSLVMKPVLNVLTGRKNDRQLYEDGKNAFVTGALELASTITPQTAIDLVRLYDSWRSEQNRNAPGKNKWGYPDRFEDRLRRFAGVTQTTFNFNRGLQGKVSRLSGGIQNVQKSFSTFLRQLQSGRDWNNPSFQKEFFEEVDNYITASYNAQQNLADHLFDAKKLHYYEDKVRKKVDNELLLNILSDRGMKKIDKNFDSSIVYNATKRGVGIFKPPSIGKTLTNQLIERYDVPSEIVQRLKAKLIKLEQQALPLLTVEDEKEK